jgi:glutathione S-transferase
MLSILYGDSILLGILYSFRRCPYAMRARLALQLCLPESSLVLREVVLKNKPQAMLDISPKATVPVLQLTNGVVIDESIDIMQWALDQNSVFKNELYSDLIKVETDQLICSNDSDFKWALDRYKYSDRFEHNENYYREKAHLFLVILEEKLSNHIFLMGGKLSLADLAIFPFVRQFAHVDKEWFEQQQQYNHLNIWLTNFLEGDLFMTVMKKYHAWEPDSINIKFPVVS